MPRTRAVEPENAPEQSKPLIEQAKEAAGGQVVNFHRQMAVSPAAFKGYLDLAGTLAGGALVRKDQEAVAIAISDKHGCTYWLSVHSAVAEQLGLDSDERGRIQRFDSEDSDRVAVLRFVREVDETRGHPSDEVFEEIRDAGYTDEQILEMIAHVALTTYSNYMNDSISTELDVPVVEPVQSA